MYPHSTRVNHTTQVQSMLNNCRITTIIDLMESFGSAIMGPTTSTIAWQVLISRKYEVWMISCYQVSGSSIGRHSNDDSIITTVMIHTVLLLWKVRLHLLLLEIMNARRTIRTTVTLQMRPYDDGTATSG